ncbi:putative HNH endonuclease [Actinoplanes missouriensis 431]|uniref:Putative HNH endonuclease n=2 Tax=Actinoplanes missouriensis TaxID=1866 RepID=I0HFN9_ACTM4|nr:putative HNH endonuclease [Actinoplanes missouriensis 431]
MCSKIVGMKEFVAQLTTAAAECGATPMWPLSEDDLLAFLDAVHSAEQMLRAAKAHAVREIEGRGIPATQQAPTPAAWLRNRLRISAGAAAGLLRQARLLDADPALNEALTGGRVNTDQLDVIARVLKTLPTGLDAPTRAEATATLIEWAPDLEPVQLGYAGRRILEHVAPEVVDAADEAALRRAERDAYEQRFLTLSPLGDGRVRVRGMLDAEAAAVVTAAIDPLCRPAGAAAELAEGGTARTPGQRRADALTDVCRLVLAGGELPANGGDRPQMVVTVGFDALKQRLAGGDCDTGEPLSPATVRKLACDAMVLPLVLGGAGQVLDAGRNRRLVTGPLRRALVARDRGCTFPGCDRPARWCEAHHVVPWFEGGPTSLDNLALLCAHHHHTIHGDLHGDPQGDLQGDVEGDGAGNQSGWQVTMGPDGHPEYRPPAWVDPERAPRTNPYHRTNPPHRPDPHHRPNPYPRRN